MKRNTWLIGFAAVALSTMSIGGPASADAGPVVDAAAPSQVSQGSSVSVAGTMTVAAQPAVTVWSDGTLAQDLPTADYPYDPNIDLIEGSVEHAKPADPLTLRIKVASGPDTGGKPYQWFRWSFQLEERWYFVEFTYMQNGASGAWQGSWYYCKLALGSSCIHGETPGFPVSWDATSRTITGRLPIADLARVQPDGTLDQDSFRPFSSQYPPESGYKTPAITLQHDNSPAFTAIELPIATVHLGIAPAGTSPDQVSFNTRALPASSDGSLDVRFVGSVPTGGLVPGSYSVFVKGCFGPCSIAEVPVTINA